MSHEKTKSNLVSPKKQEEKKKNPECQRTYE